MPTPDDLFAEAERQLNICNACRYCEGYCAVFPALERRTMLETGDITQLASLCHDCRACFQACMYAAPHEFAVDPPAILTAVRQASYRHYLPSPGWLWPGWLRPGWLRPGWLRPGWFGPGWLRRDGQGGLGARATAAVGVGAALLALVAVAEGIGALLRHRGPYQVIPYPALLVTVALPTAWTAAVMLRAVTGYWHDTHGPLRDLANWRALATALRRAARLEYLRGGGGECPYPGDDPSPARRRLHAAVAWGFATCFAATLAAAFLQDILGIGPPYPLLSAPVILGTAGGISMLAGCAGLMMLKRRDDPPPSAGDYGLIVGLGLLALTGMLTLVFRDTPAYGLILIAHLSTIVICFAIAPYTGMVHAVYRFLAIVADVLEQT
jgi:citrate/tricarballylate utilization protein